MYELGSVPNAVHLLSPLILIMASVVVLFYHCFTGEKTEIGKAK